MDVTQAARTERTIEVGDRQIFVTEVGAGPAVVLLHGGGAGATGASNYARNIDALAEHFHVIVPDMPGYGQSTKRIDHSDPFGDLASFLGGLIKALGLEKVHLIGNSYGGAAALRLAIEKPELVDRLILMGPGGIGTTRSLPTAGLNALLAYYGGKGPSLEKITDFIRTYLVFDPNDAPADLIELRYQASIDPEVVANPPLRRPSGPFALRTLWRMDFTRDSRLAQVQNKTLVVWGARDKVNRPSGALMLAETMPNCDAHLVANTGHWVQWEKADLFNALAVAHLKDSSLGADQ
ncbi:4,5:9,10-diseco-3-hydroxy-5,9,17-trioxoandrosta-1(10),2-diene-4-oate hydrolase [Marmoricola sp. OAE513]|uniref:alpha/beta fold hydrolase n=1 Tax=Marmoricola sp. OAE513 TaxID=2817894 RepID=UPI001D94BC1A